MVYCLLLRMMIMLLFCCIDTCCFLKCSWWFNVVIKIHVLCLQHCTSVSLCNCWHLDYLLDYKMPLRYNLLWMIDVSEWANNNLTKPHRQITCDYTNTCNQQVSLFILLRFIKTKKLWTKQLLLNQSLVVKQWNIIQESNKTDGRTQLGVHYILI